jgi:hypothetical protein
VPGHNSRVYIFLILWKNGSDLQTKNGIIHSDLKGNESSIPINWSMDNLEDRE